jgi:hypothetical protein
MNISYTTYPGRFLITGPMTDPPWTRSPFSELGLATVAGPP